MNKPVRILLVGFYDGQNIGDQAILRAAVQQIKTLATADQPITITVLSSNPQLIRTQHPLIDRVLQLRNPFHLFKALLGCDLLIFAGGAMLFDFSWLDSIKLCGKSPILFWLALTVAARILGRKVFWLGVGVGPLNSRLSTALIRLTAPLVSHITLRDEYSHQLLQNICNHKLKRITTTADWAFTLEPPPLTAPPISDKPYIVLVPANIPNHPQDPLDFFAYLSAHLDLNCIVLPTHRLKDKQAFAALGQIHWPETLDDYLAVLAGAELVVSMRMHAIILAGIVGVPALTVKTYDPKLTSITELLNPKTKIASLDNPAAAFSQVTAILTDRNTFANNTRQNALLLGPCALTNLDPISQAISP